MSDSSWSDNPNAPKIPYPVYYFEKVLFAGDFISLIIYGVYKKHTLSVLAV